jgi:hypothetical protein
MRPPGRRADDGTMTESAVENGPGFPRLALGAAWLCSTVILYLLGRSLGPPAGPAVLGLALVGLLAAGAVTSNRYRRVTLSFSTVAAVATAVGGVAIGAVGRHDTVALTAGATAVVAGVLAERLTARSRAMSA